MKKIVIAIIGILAVASIYSHGDTKEDESTNQIIFSHDDDFVIREISVTNWDFSDKEIKIDKNEKTRLIFTVESGHHGIRIRGLDLKSGNLEREEQVIWDLENLETGEYSFYCNVPCGQGHSSMRGIIIVK